MPPEGNCPLVRVGVSVKVRVSFRVGANQTIAPEENCPLFRVRVWVRISFGVGGQFSSGQFSSNHFINRLSFFHPKKQFHQLSTHQLSERNLKKLKG